MAKPHQLIRASEIEREHLLGIPGVGARNVSKVEERLETYFAKGGAVGDLTVEDIKLAGTISEEAADEIVAWVQRHVSADLKVAEDAPKEEPAEDDIVWDKPDPIYALAFDPAVAVQDAVLLLKAQGADGTTVYRRLDAVEKWMKGEVAPYRNGVPA